MLRCALFLLTLLAPAVLHAQTAPAPLPRAQFIIEMDGRFRMMDADKDGHLTRIEIEQFHKAAALAEAGTRNRALFAALDADKNGQISPAEFLRMPMNVPRSDASATMGFDASRDGKVSLIEHRTATLANFDRLDTDKDGNVSTAEGRAGGVIK